MSKPVRPSSFAQTEIQNYVRRYEAELSGLGDRLWRDIQAVVEVIGEHPSIGERVRRIREVVRRVPLRHFPFFVVYRERADEVQIVALAHMSRRPNYWRSRLASD